MTQPARGWALNAQRKSSDSGWASRRIAVRGPPEGPGKAVRPGGPAILALGRRSHPWGMRQSALIHERACARRAHARAPPADPPPTPSHPSRRFSSRLHRRSGCARRHRAGGCCGARTTVTAHGMARGCARLWPAPEDWQTVRPLAPTERALKIGAPLLSVLNAVKLAVMFRCCVACRPRPVQTK